MANVIALQVTVGSTPTLLFTATAARSEAIVRRMSGEAVWVGDNSVTPQSGNLVDGNPTITLWNVGDTIYGITRPGFPSIVSILVTTKGDITEVTTTTPLPAPVATITSVTVGTSSIVVKAANVARRQIIVVNDGGTVVFLAFAATASTAAYTVRLAANDRYESPLGGYVGVVSGIRSSGSSAVIVTEVTF